MTGTIDFPSYLKDDRVFLLSGALDTVVEPGVVKKLLEYYSNFVDAKNIAENFTIPAEHAMVCVCLCVCVRVHECVYNYMFTYNYLFQITDDYGNACNILVSPFINNCNYSAAYNILQHIYGDIQPANKSAANASNVSV